MRRIYIFSAAVVLIFCGCTVDLNELSSSSESSSENVFSQESDTDSHTDVFYTMDTDSESDTDTDTDTEIQVKAFDESRYLTMFVTGSSKIPLLPDAVPTSTTEVFLKYGEPVSIIQPDVMGYSFVYNSTLEKFGYIPKIYLTDYQEEASLGDVMYVKSPQATVYSDLQLSETAYISVQNDMLTVLAKRVDGNWRVMDKFDRVGYIDSSLLSDKKIKNESKKNESKKSKKNSSDSESKSTVSSKFVSSESVSSRERETETEITSSSEASSSEEPIAKGNYTGVGDPPEEYIVYVCDVDVDYLLLRAAPDRRADTIGEIYLDELIYVIDSSNYYWYVYAPKLGMYGYVTGDTDYLYPQE